MARIPARLARHATAYGRFVEIAGLTVLAYVPFLASSPRRVSGDTKQFLYLDPGRLLARAPYLWDPHVAAGTVPHQQIGYLFPMGPYYWLMDQVGVPDWIAQRLWLGTISLVAVLGARWLFTMLGTGRAGALAGALIYMLTPYQLAFTARISVLLLPWAALPWLIGLTMRAVRRGGWQDPALIALLILAVGSVNASALLLAGVGPLLWLLLEALRGRDALRAVTGATARIGVLAVGVSIWWAVGLRLQGAYGLPVLQLTENVKTVASASSPNDVLRGLGNWFFYGRDRIGYSLDQASDYASNHVVVTLSYAVPALGLLAAFVTRWRHRAYFALLIVVGTVIAVGAWPYDNPSPYGRVWKNVASNWSPMLALRNTPRIVPIVVLGVAALLAAAVGSVAARRTRVLAAMVVGALAFAAFSPVWSTGYLSDGVERWNDIPSYWHAAAAAMQRDGNSTRVLEIPGSNFAAYRWGNTVEPVTPALIDRPYVAREVLPYGTPPSVDFLDAFDRRLQLGTFEPGSLAPFARFLDIGTVSLRSDLAWERNGTPRPRLLWSQLTQPLPKGVRAPTGFGQVVRNAPPVPPVDELELRTPVKAPDPPPVALFEVDGTPPIVHTAPTSQPVVLAGSGDGIVDATGAGLLDGKQLVFELASMDSASLRRALASSGDLVLTDSNRRRFRNFFSSIRDTSGPTERAGQTTTDPNGYDFRLDVFPGTNDTTRTVVEQLGGRVDATRDGGADRPEDRPVHAFDGDLRTSWRVGGAKPAGNRITLQPDRPVRADHVTLVQPLDGPRDRVLTKVRLRFDNGAPVDGMLGPESFTTSGQVVRFPARTVKRLDIELVATSKPPFAPQFANAVGFAEVRLGTARVTETVRLPIDIARRVGDDARGHPLDVVMTRLRQEPANQGRQDEELVLDRTFVLPDARQFQFSGTARIDPRAPDELVDSVLGTTAPGTAFSASSHLAGDIDARASRAFDGDPSTAWTAAIGPQEGQWLDVALPRNTTVGRLQLTVVADGRHSVPTQLRLEAGSAVRTIAVPPITDAAAEGTTRTLTLPFDPVTARRLHVVVEAVRHPTIAGQLAGTVPLAVADLKLAGVPVPAAPRNVSTGCRDDLLTVDGAAVGVRIAGPVADARNGLPIAACDASLELTARSHRLRSRAGLDTAIDIDRAVLSSDATGHAAAASARGAPLSASGATVTKTNAKSTSVDVRVQTDGKPFWLVLGQSHSNGWKTKVSGGAVGSLQLVDGYANGWLVRPTRAGTMTIALQWKPQRLVWLGFATSALAIVVCVGLLLIAARRRTASAVIADTPVWAALVGDRTAAQPPWVPTVVVAAVAALVTAAVSRPWIAVVTGVATVLVARVPRLRVALVIAVPALLAFSRLRNLPELAWLALALFSVDFAVGRLRRTPDRAPPPTTVPRP